MPPPRLPRDPPARHHGLQRSRQIYKLTVVTTPATFLASLLATLQAHIAHHAAKDRVNGPMLLLVWSYLPRALLRFQRLYARWQAGTLPKPRPAQLCPAQLCPGRPARPRAPATAPRRPRLTRRHGFVSRVIGYQACNLASGLRHLLARPDCAEFLAAAPQAARILRPLCRLLGATLPPALALPPRPRRPRPPKPVPAPPQPRWGKHDLRAIRRYSPGPIPDRRPKPA